jgi:hypothetical protein
MTTKLPKDLVFSRFIYEIFKTVYNNTVLRFVIQSFLNHDKTIVDDNKFPTLTGHLEDLLVDHKNDIEYVHGYIHTQVKQLIDNTKNDRDQAGLNGQAKITLRRLQDEYHSIVPYVRPPSKKAQKAKALEELLSFTKPDSSPPKSTISHRRLNPQANALLKVFQETYGNDIRTIALIDLIPNANFEGQPTVQTLKYILSEKRYMYVMVKNLLDSSRNIDNDAIGVAVAKLMRRDKVREDRFA